MWRELRCCGDGRSTHLAGRLDINIHPLAVLTPFRTALATPLWWGVSPQSLRPQSPR